MYQFIFRCSLCTAVWKPFLFDKFVQSIVVDHATFQLLLLQIRSLHADVQVLAPLYVVNIHNLRMRKKNYLRIFSLLI